LHHYRQQFALPVALLRGLRQSHAAPSRAARRDRPAGGQRHSSLPRSRPSRRIRLRPRRISGWRTQSVHRRRPGRSRLAREPVPDRPETSPATSRARILTRGQISRSCFPKTIRYDRPMSLKGKTVFITGASSGIGESTAYTFAAEGARLLLCARRKDKVDAVAQAAREKGAPAVHTFALDVQNRAAVAEAIAAIPAEWSAIDILVNNAGLSRGLDKLYQGDIQDWEE